MKKILYITLLFFVALTGCNKTLDINSVRVVAEVNMWNKLEDTRAGLLGVYALTRAALSDNDSHWLYGDVRTGEFISPNRPDLKAIAGNKLNASYPTVDALSDWTRFYAIVNAANIFLERVGDVKAADKRYTENNMIVDVAQARFLRAFAYFYMVRIWGDVPFIITSHDGKFENKPRENQGKILVWAQQEMLTAAADLPFIYSGGDVQQPGNYYNEDRTRWGGALATKNTAYAVLAHLAAWQGNYTDVATYTKFVEDNYGKSGIGFQNTEDLTKSNGFFFNKNTSQMFGFNSDWGHIDGSGTGHIEELTLAEPVLNKKVPDIYMPKDTILKIFNQPNDERFSVDTLGLPRSERYFTNINGKYPIFSKIKVIQGGTTDPTFRYFTSALIFTRLEDIVLLRAEALAVLGDQNGALNELLNVMTRRGITTITINSGELIELIFEERHRELLGEGQRWYDLVRYNKIKQNNPAFLNLINSQGIYWPISRKLISQNNLLTQNPFWK
ncbi:RagB/SusD family nutrient uptake outer membrane protein [Mucilaginibacter sp. KACC 22773]|uniref:RagB/SusD family nutrient uptake outer membrane protein n=1 Tax=Mucilaginibacter sp. KACC 22773 TaxID=3025671 RepID=UPI002366DFEC|nr:RagB/SusD family nutrient uptake outer membrane protein [Mucilaginibacter sp. KACC 22773]WDF75484.1 RagB/SusD family nutrient uptake outer membrane protein [Mucilaginibacter sp. KACC 22773]